MRETPSITISNPGIEIKAIKAWGPLVAGCKPGYILRAVNKTGQEIEADIEFARLLQVEKVTETDILERESQENAVQEAKKSRKRSSTFITKKWGPHEFKTLLLQ